jgi:hypothetical protein
VPPKSAIGKGVSVSIPASGTIKSSTGVTAIAASSLSLSKQSSNSNVSIEKSEESKPTEIVSLADFNRVYERGGFPTSYGNYYSALDSVHSITTDDVSYAISKCIENDASGRWGSLKDSLETAIEDADDFVEDLANIDEKLEQAIKSLDFIRSGDSDLQQAGQDYLSSKLRDYETPASERKFDIDNILAQSPTIWDPNPTPPSESFSSTGGNSSALKMLLSDKISSKIEKKPFQSTFDLWGQGRETKDLNPAGLEAGIEGGKYWNSFSGGGLNSLTEPIEIISRVLSISTGIVRVEQDAISQKIAFKRGNLGSSFEGTKNAESDPPRPADSVPYRKNFVGSSLTALSMLQHKKSDGTWVIPVEVEDAPEKRDYKSGPTALIREPLLNGDYKFSDFDLFTTKFEEGRIDVETYVEKMLGLLDPTSKITPIEILRIILTNFNDALSLANSDESSKYQLLYTCLAGRSGSKNASLSHQLLRIAGRIKHYKIKSRSGTGAGEDATTQKTLVTSKVSKKSESLKSDAEATTTQNEDKSDVAAQRTIARVASSSPPSADMSGLMLAFMRSIAGSDQLTGEELNQRADAAVQMVKSLNIFKSSLSSNIDNQDDLKTAIDRLNKQISALNSYARDLRAQAGRTPPYTDESVIAKYYEDAMKKTSGSFWSFMVKAYDEIIQKAQSRLPEGEKMTDALGRTLYGGFDEFGLLAMIVRCFVILSNPLNISVARSYKTPRGRIEDFIASVNSGDIADALDAFLQGNKMAVIGYSSNLIKDYKEELTLLTSDLKESELKLFQFNSAVIAKGCLDYLKSETASYQNAMAYLAAFSKVMNNSKNDLIEAFSNILQTSERKNVLDTTTGREMMSNITTQQIVYRRSLLDKYRPMQNLGYLPARFAFSLPESLALKSLLAAPQLSDKSSENIRLITAALPAGSIDNSKKYRDPDLGQQNYTGMVELVVHRRDHELDDVIFKEKIFLFDPQLYVVPDSFTGYRRSKSSSSSDQALEIAKRITFKIYSRDGSQILKYQDFASNSRYKNLNSSQIDEIVRNTTFSYLMESYLYKTTGMIFDESVTLDVKDTISQTAIAALNATSQQKLPDVVLPTPEQLSSFILESGDIDYLNQTQGVSSGDKEMIAALASSYIMRDEKPIDRLLANSLFDRVFLIAVDPDSFEINKEETISRNGDLGKSMLQSLSKNGYLVESNGSLFVIPRDPMRGGFSVGDISCQFIPHTSSKTKGSMLKLAKSVMNQKTSLEKSSKISKHSQDSSKTSKSIIKKGTQR